MNEELEQRLTQIEEKLKMLGRQVTAIKEQYEQALVEINIIKEGGNI